MSVQTEIDRIITAVGSAYDAVEAKGGTAPAAQTIEGLAAAVGTIQAITVEPITITENGVTTAPEGKAYSPITVNVPSKEEQAKIVDLNMSNGNQTITPDIGKVLTSVKVIKPSTLIPDNIKKDVNIGGVVGSMSGGSVQWYAPID